MLQGLIVKKIFELVFKKLLKKYNLDRIKDYVENKNALDFKVEVMEARLRKMEKHIGIRTK